MDKDSNEVITSQHRRVSYDILRIVACFMVIIDHTAGGFLINTPYNRWWLLLDAYYFLSKPAVALFFMLSGALLLKKEESVRDWLVKRVLRMILIIVIFTLPTEIITHQTSFTIAGYLQFLWSKSSGAYWYLYAYLGLMIMLPITRKLIKNLENWEYLFGFSICFVFSSIVPQLVLYNIIPYYNLNFSVGIFGISSYTLFILGHFLGNVHIFEVDRKKRIIGLVLIFACYFLAVLVTRYEYMNIDNVPRFLSLDRYDAPTSVIPAVVLFIFAANNSVKYNALISNVILVISKTTFGIYLLSDMGIAVMMRLYLIFMGKGLQSVFACFLYDISVFAVLCVLVMGLRLIPGIKKLL